MNMCKSNEDLCNELKIAQESFFNVESREIYSGVFLKQFQQISTSLHVFLYLNALKIDV